MKGATGSWLCVLALGGCISACNDFPSRGTAATTPAESGPAAAAPARFMPPAESDIPEDEIGAAILLGRNIFVHTRQYAKDFVGNGLNCANCHLDSGRRADSAPLWAAYGLYPAFRQKSGQVDTLQSRIQGCFLYSMDGTAPAVDSEEVMALVVYSHWLATGAPSGVRLPGQGYPELAEPGFVPDMARGKEIYRDNCAICHGTSGEGIQAGGEYAFPPLWGENSFNWGAGMHRINTAAGFIHANMPYGLGGTLSEQQAWDVALFINSHERPQDPRYQGDLGQTRDEHHDEYCLYGRTPEELRAFIAD